MFKGESLVVVAVLVLVGICYPKFFGKRWTKEAIDGYRMGVTASTFIYMIFSLGGLIFG